MENEIELNDISNDLLIINKTTIERLFQEESKDPLVLYLFYYKTAKWQKHNPIKATDDYAIKCLHWGDHKVKNAKKRLKEMELIEVEKRVNDKQQIDGWYIRVNYFNSSGANSSSAISPLVEKQPHKILNNNNINTINNINKKEIHKERFTKPTLEEVEEYCKSRNNSVNAQHFIDFYESKGWMVGKNKMKDWKACVRTWEQKETKKEVMPAWAETQQQSEHTKEEIEEFEELLNSFHR